MPISDQRQFLLIDVGFTPVFKVLVQNMSAVQLEQTAHKENNGRKKLDKPELLRESEETCDFAYNSVHGYCY